MRNTSHTADLEVGSVEAIVDEHGRLEGLGRLIPAHATMCSVLASPTMLFVVVMYRAAPSTTAADGPRRWPAEHVQRARSMAQVNAEFGATGCPSSWSCQVRDDWSEPGQHVPQLEEPFDPPPGRFPRVPSYEQLRQ